MIDLLPAQTAIYGALTTAPATYAVHDAVPQNAPYPYFVIGEIDATPGEELAAAGADASFNLHAWSKAAGKAQAHAMLQFARARLDNQTISGAWACSEDFVQVMEDRTSTAASRLFHGIARYMVRVG